MADQGGQEKKESKMEYLKLQYILKNFVNFL